MHEKNMRLLLLLIQEEIHANKFSLIVTIKSFDNGISHFILYRFIIVYFIQIFSLFVYFIILESIFF